MHIPFCARKCGYCDFYSVTDLAATPRVVAALCGEMERERDFLPTSTLDTIYIGGGTPSLLAPAQLRALLDKAGEVWDCSGAVEVTVEVNPDDLSAGFLADLRETPVNRLSIGIQSFIDRDLAFMNRRHDAAQAVAAVERALAAGFTNISIDLIYGIPGMSAEEWRYNIERAVSLGVKHISAYCLTVEDDTPFGRLRDEGKLGIVPDETIEQQYLMLHDVLSAAGFEHYEVSNFALPGFRSRHNSSYWSGEPYLGVGPSAHSFDGRSRRWCAPDLGGYLSGPGYETETLTPCDLYNEYIMTALRRTEGIDARMLAEKFGDKKLEMFIGQVARLIEADTVVTDGRHYRIPPHKFLLSDAVIRQLFDTD